MSSWLGGLGSGLGQSLGQVGGSLSSFTGQISTFTKDMLLEGVEEVGDATTELHVSNSKLSEMEAAFIAQKSEYERLKQLHMELEEKLEASEIQNKQQSTEYRTLLQQKDVEISHLKARQSGLQEDFHKLHQTAQSASGSPAVLPVTSASSAASFLPRPPGAHQGFHGDDMDLSDVIWSQQEINRLTTEVTRLEAELSHWRHVAQASNVSGAANGDQGEVLKLQRTIKELREALSREVDEHQHELAALQDAQRHKMADITRRHREELAEYEERIEELEEQNQSADGQATSQADPPQLVELQRSVRSLQEAAERRERQLQEATASLEEAARKHTALRQEKQEAQEENAELLQNYTRLQMSVAELQARVQEQEGKTLQKAQLQGEIQGLRKALAGAENEIHMLKSLAETKPKEEVEHADILELNTIIGTLQQEKEILEGEKRDLQDRLSAAEQGRGSADPEELEDVRAQLEKALRSLKDTQEERDTIMSEMEELDLQNHEATQHMISVKDQLSAQLREAEKEVSQLSAALDAASDQKRALQQSLEEHQEKLSQSAFSLNELHMGRQALEVVVKELKDKLGRAQEQSKEARGEAAELRRALQETQEHLSAARAELPSAGDMGQRVGGGLPEREEEPAEREKELAEREEELADVKKELAELKRAYEQVMSQDYEMKMENRRVKEQLQAAVGQVEELGRQVREKEVHMEALKLEKEALNEALKLEKDTRIEALKLEKDQLEAELSQAERALSQQARQYQQTVEELSRARSMDATALQKEHERAVRLSQERELEIGQLRREAEQAASDHRDTNEMLAITVAGQKQLTDLLQEKDSFADTLKRNAAELQGQLESRVQAAAREAEALRQALEEKDRQLGAMKEENSHLKEEMERVREPTADPRTLDIITELEAEIGQLRAARNALEEEAQGLRASLETERARDYERLLRAREDELARLQQAWEGRGAPSPPPLQGEVILQEDKSQALNREPCNEKHDLSKVDIQRLARGLEERDAEIGLLKEKTLSLSQTLLQKDLEIQALHARLAGGAGGRGPAQDVLFLQQQLQAYAVEREQVLAVLNEKARENSQLRHDYHRLVDVVAGKEAALLKLQQENQHLSSAGDPSGAQAMFRETVQNLSRIIREKDIEIDALTQKCQTLVAVLQASPPAPGDPGAGGGVSSNQFEELLQERDGLQQQVKKMEEWKQQVITTVRNMQHESAQLHQELVTLQGQVSADSDCSSQLSVDYARLIQSYERKERRLGSLSQELAQVQQTISQLSTTKDVLLGKLDSVAQPPENAATTAQESGDFLAAEPPSHRGAAAAAAAAAPDAQRLQEEVQSLRTLLAEKEATIRTLQENNQRLSNTASASDSEHRGQAEEARQARERLGALQRAVREKDLLIKSKGDQLGQLSEALRNRDGDNEVLRQAVTNLKERALAVELEARTLKEENEQVAARSREKESEFRALQETNMQVSLLLREKEFELSTVSEKAATIEKMLKDKEQGKSGELNQLLNEMRSMQQKAVAFQQERDQVMLALKQKQMETTAIQTELQHVKDKEQRLNLELQRLRNHLLEMEDSYTREALSAEDREAELRRRVLLLEDRLATSSNAVENASQQACMQVESLQEQLSGVVKQRDDALLQLQAAQEQVNQYAVSLSNLQMVLEQFQQEEKAMYSAELDRHKKEKDEWRRKAQQLEDKASALQLNLDEANTALESASRLTDQLDMKEEEVEELRRQVTIRQEMLEEAQDKLMNLLNSTEGKVDKVLMRNLFMGYFHTPKNKRCEVMRLMGSVLGLNQEDVDKMLVEDRQQGVTGWVSSWLGGRGAQSVPNTPLRPTHSHSLNSSFSEMFVKFLEVESRPAMPAPTMLDFKPLSPPPAGRTTSTALHPSTGGTAPARRPGESNPFLAPRSAAVPLLGGGGAGGHLLMKPISDALPTFTPVPVSAEASGGAVLKDLLKQ